MLEADVLQDARASLYQRGDLQDELVQDHDVGQDMVQRSPVLFLAGLFGLPGFRWSSTGARSLVDDL